MSPSTGYPFYWVNVKYLYWDYELIASVYKGFNLSDMQLMTVRQRDFWFRMAKWRNSNGG